MKGKKIEIADCCIRGRKISVVNCTPEYRAEERVLVKKAIEQQLYEIFCKYR